MKFKDILSGNFLSSKAVVNRFPSFILIFVLLVLYISNTFNSQNIFRRILKVEKEIQQLKVTAATISVKKIEITQEINIKNEIEKRNIGIHYYVNPPAILKQRK